MTVFHRGVSPRLIDDFGRGSSEFALIAEAPILVFAFRFGATIPWSTALYSWHLQSESRRVVPRRASDRDARAFLWTTLVGCDDGVIHAQRGLTLGPEFRLALNRSIRSQSARAFDPRRCMAAVGSLIANRADGVPRLDLALARTVGNA